MRQPPNKIDGILVVDKPMDWTSHDVVNCVKRRFNLNKVGHCGTLDPIATGLLVILMGKATKLQDHLMGQDKTYLATMRLGTETDSEDRTGNIIATATFDTITEQQIYDTAKTFLGIQEQVPPMVSAIKQNGQPLYKLARKGQTVERKPREITISSFEINIIELPDVIFTLKCSKGTYVRTICADFGRKLGCGAMMAELRRTGSGDFTLQNAVDIEQIKSWELPELQQNLLPIESIAL
ncbi:MAG: tRNA pseudouridine(55) synthase TruB [Lentisphaerae bacterium]|nr:tRNA pseudouridine(55) synthase TruB [Lentisphaerota bacterium]